MIIFKEYVEGIPKKVFNVYRQKLKYSLLPTNKKNSLIKMHENKQIEE